MFIFNKQYIQSRSLLLGVLLGGSLLLSMVISILFASPTFARMDTSTKPTDRATSYSYYKAAQKCVESHMRSNIRTTTGSDGATSPSHGTTDDKWFDDFDAWVTVYPSGKENCASLLTKAMSLWGWTDSKQFLRDIGYTFNSSVPAWERPNNNARERLNGFNAAIASKVGNVSALLDGSAKYALYLGLFTTDKPGLGACSARQLGVLSSLDSTQQNAARNNEFRDGRNYTVVKLFDPATNTMVDYGYTYLKQAEGGGVTNYASAWNYRGSNYAGGTGEHFTCEQLVTNIRSNAQAFFLWNRANPENVDTVPGTTGPSSGTDGCETGQTCDTANQTTCAIEGVGWIVCPVTNALAVVADGAFSYLADAFLEVDAKVVSSEADNGTYQAWMVMRNVANVAFVIAFLFIIFSQLTGQGIANYGIKKMLPRLVVAAVLVNLSYIICQLAVDLSNILGYSIKQVFESIGGGISGSGYNPTDESTNWVGLTVAVLAGGAIAWSLGVPVLVPLLLGAVIAILMIVLILIVRQVLIILLIVLSPLAFVAFLLPNTDQWFSKWRKAFTVLLLVFPIIGLLFGAAGLASDILTPIYSEDSDIIGKIIAAAVVAIPLFLLPALLKGSLDAIPAVGRRLNGMSDRFGKSARTGAANNGIVKSLAHRKTRTRAQVGAGVYSGWNPVGKLRSKVNSGLNKNRAYNAVTGDYGTMRGATINKLEDEETKMAEAAIQLKARGEKGEGIGSQFEKAIARNDVVLARAAQNILMQSGGPGVNEVKDKISAAYDTMGPQMRSVLADNISENHAQVAKAKSKDILNWAIAGGKQSVQAHTAAAETWGGLTPAELTGQTDISFQKALESGGVSLQTIQALSSGRMNENLTQKKRAALEAYRTEKNISHSEAVNTPQQTSQAGVQQSTTPQTTQTTPIQTVPTTNTTTPATISADGGIDIPHDTQATVLNPAITTPTPVVTSTPDVATNPTAVNTSLTPRVPTVADTPVAPVSSPVIPTPPPTAIPNPTTPVTPTITPETPTPQTPPPASPGIPASQAPTSFDANGVAQVDGQSPDTNDGMQK